MPIVPLVPENHTHALAEFDCLDPLLAALRLDSGRLKCTCLAVSRKWLALGTSAGGLHLIQREGWKQRLIVTHKEGSITQVACCPHDEDFIAVATSQGLVVVWELQLERRGRPERVSVSWEHRGQAITALCWDTNTLKVFVGDTVGKVSFLRAGSSKTGKGTAFVIFPVQTVTTVDSKVVQLGFQDGCLLVSSLTRCYICDTEKEKFWRVGHKERDGEYGACFFPQNKGLLLGQAPLLYCARPGSRIWEANFNGEVVSTHQFKQLLTCPPLPLITYRNEPQYNASERSPQSLAFTKLLYMADQNLLTWTDSAIFIFTPQNAVFAMLSLSLFSDVADIVVYRSELFCLHGSGRLSHFTLLSAERCVERLLRRESWLLAAVVCCMFQHAITTSRVNKVYLFPAEPLRHCRADGTVGEVINKLEPLDSASSSRRSSISSHESFNVLDCGIYRVISRKGSQSDEETGSLLNQSVSEEERLKDFSFVQDEDQVDHGKNRLSYVSSFMKKTTEKINTLQMNSELRKRPEYRDGPTVEMPAPSLFFFAMVKLLFYSSIFLLSSQIQDPLVLLDPVSLEETLLEWLPALERVLGPVKLDSDSGKENSHFERESPLDHKVLDADPSNGSRVEPIRVGAPKPVPSDLMGNLSQLAMLYTELSCFRKHQSKYTLGSCTFLRRYFFLLDHERVRKMCLLCYKDQADIQSSFIEAMQGQKNKSRSISVVKGELKNVKFYIDDQIPTVSEQPVKSLGRCLYEKDGEAAVRSCSQFYPTVTPADVMIMADQRHFLAYLDNLVQSRAEDHRLSFLQSLLDPESLRQDWLELALSNDAPLLCDTLTSSGDARWHSHCFSWGYGRLLSLLIRLPADLASKQVMAESCRSHGYWMGYLYLCKQMQRRSEAFSTICQLDDISLLEEPEGVEPHSLDEWKLLIQLSQQSNVSPEHVPGVNGGGGWSDESGVSGGKVSPETLTLMLARSAGPDVALAVLQECGVQLDLTPHSKLICELLRVTEKRQRAMIQTMLERCDRFLWSQHA
uniref:Hermansky-Pudlak syndrome 5 protein homolog n=1 Tax=Neogobius melanostomus TaxID=47308 RepID=A0A8C6UPU7_9GOBI